MQKTINRNDYSLDGIVDLIVSLLVESRINGDDIYLVYCELDQNFTVELNDGAFIMRENGAPVQYNNANIERMFAILCAPTFDYK